MKIERFAHLFLIITFAVCTVPACTTIHPGSLPAPTATITASPPVVYPSAKPSFDHTSPTPTVPPPGLTPFQEATATPTPTAELAPSAKPFHPENTFLAYIQAEDTTLHLVNADGLGIDTIRLPKKITNSTSRKDDPQTPDIGHISIDNLKHNLSPDGTWLAYYQDEAGPGNQLANVTLSLFNVRSQAILKIDDLFPIDYPKNFQDLENELTRLDPKKNIYDTKPAQLNETFLAGIRAMAWSPDSRVVAFSGGIDSLSSDLYLYDMATSSLTHVNDGPGNIAWLEWTLDARYIFFSTAIKVSESDQDDYFVYDTETRTIRSVAVKNDHGLLTVGPWVSKTSQLISWVSPDSDAQNFLEAKVVDYATGIVAENANTYFTRDRQIQVYTLSTSQAGRLGIQPGVYQVDMLTGIQTQIYSGDCAGAWSWPKSKYRYLLSCDSTTLAWMADGTVKKVLDLPYTYTEWPISSNQTLANPSMSPDGQYAVVWVPADNHFELFRADGQWMGKWSGLSKTHGLVQSVTLHWNDSSTGIFYFLDNGLYYRAIPSLDWKLLDAGANFLSDMAWID